MGPISLFDLPHEEARRLVQTGAPVYLTVNPVEYHGPHLSMHNDRLISEGLIRDLHARLRQRHPEWPFLVAGDLEIGVEPCWGPGSRHTRYPVAQELIGEACRALAELGARRVVIMTFHGSPLHSHAIDLGVRLLEGRGARAVAPFNIVLQELVRLDPNRFADALAHVEDPSERAEMLRTLALDFHAGFFETSVALHYVPDSVSPNYRTLAPCPPIQPSLLLVGAELLARALGRDVLAGELGFAAAGIGWYKLKPFPGYTGRPHRATREAGAIFARFMLDQFEPAVEAVLDGREKGPRPIMQWLRYASLGGRWLGVQLSEGQMEGIDA